MTSTQHTHSSSQRLWLAYWALWLGAGFVLALAAWQDPNHRPGRAAWEPFVLEMSSLLASGLLALAAFRLARRLHQGSLPRLLFGHLLGAVAFAIAHLALLHLFRWPFYWLLAERHYAPLPLWQALRFEGAKDLVTYLVIAALCHGWLWRQREQALALAAARAEALQTQLQLAQLSTRLQPHFLFNSLNTVAALVEENPRAAVRMLARLGDYLRGALRSEGGAEHALSDELQSLRDYLAIQALRFEDALQAEIAVPEALKSVPVPRLMLQPLVENAIRHSAPAPELPLRLRLRAWAEAERLHIELHNHPAQPQGGGTGLGLDLVREQLRLLHGMQARLDAGDDGQGGFQVTLHLPLRGTGHG